MVILAGSLTVVAGVFGWSRLGPQARRTTTLVLDSSRLVSVDEMYQEGYSCNLRAVSADSSELASADKSLFDEIEQTSVRAADTPDTVDMLRPPVRTVFDSDPIYSAIAVDPLRNEVILVDTNTFSVKTFNRGENTPAGARASVPLHAIEGPKTKLEFDNGLYIDPKTGDVTTVAADNDFLVTFPHGASGNIEPSRTLKITHRGYALAVNEDTQEMYLSVQYPPQISVYHKDASGDDKPIRLLKGENTRLSDVHGMTIDTKHKLLLADNWGHVSNDLVAGTGRFEAPSISVYPLDADGDTPPINVIQGPKTQLNWPAMISVDPATGDLFVADDLGESILVFHETDKGDVAPYRVIKGTKTRLSNPTGVFVDSKNQELWVSNLGNSSAVAFALSAKGDQAPLRVIRTAPADKESLKFGKPSGTAYDSKREQLLVAN
jgi:hypothetical protein